MEQLDLMSWTAPKLSAPRLSGDADGITFEKEHDRKRLDRHRDLIFKFMSDGLWHTPASICEALGTDWASSGARLRDLRKPKFGGWDVQRKRSGDPDSGCWIYRMVRP